MDSTAVPPPVAPPELLPHAQAGYAERAVRLLACLRKVLGHDLPNQLVAVKGLLQLLDLDEKEHLTADGRHLLQRVTDATERAQKMVSTLKDIARLGVEPVALEVVPLAQVTEEVTAQFKQEFPECQVDARLNEPRALAPRRALHHVLLYVLRTLKNLGGLEVTRLELKSRVGAEGVDLWLSEGSLQDWGSSLAVPRDGSGPVLGGHLEWFAIKESVEAWGGKAVVWQEPGLGHLVLLRTPGPVQS